MYDSFKNFEDYFEIEFVLNSYVQIVWYNLNTFNAQF